MIDRGSIPHSLQSDEVIEIVANGLQPLLRGRKNSLIIIPDSTRTLPLRLLFPVINQVAKQQMCHIDYLIALGTHPPLSDIEIEQLLGKESLCESREKHGIKIINHDWMNKNSLSCLGKISASEVSEITGGLLEIEIPVVINKLIHSYEQIVICGPVFPHEVAGFSGGEKYLFPGIAGEEIIHITHWLGALSTSMDTIGKADTLVRKIIHRASSFIKTPVVNMAFCLKGKEVFGVFIGDMKETWEEASKLSAKIDITHVPGLYKSVLSIPSNIYNELWTAAKAMYKLEPVVADGGELIIFAPHLCEISLTHGDCIKKVGYHVRDFFINQWDSYQDYPWAVLAHSTHVKGKGVFKEGIEIPRIHVKLSTGISKELCQKINLEYIDPDSISFADWENSKDRLLVHNAGETLYRSI